MMLAGLAWTMTLGQIVPEVVRYLIHSAELVEQKAPRRFVRILKPVGTRAGSAELRRLSACHSPFDPAIDAADQYADR